MNSEIFCFTNVNQLFRRGQELVLHSRHNYPRSGTIIIPYNITWISANQYLPVARSLLKCGIIF